MRNVQTFAAMLFVFALLIGWSWLHHALWVWLLGPQSWWTLVGGLVTSFVLPGFAMAAFFDHQENASD